MSSGTPIFRDNGPSPSVRTLSIESHLPLPEIPPTLFAFPVPEPAGHPQKIVDLKKYICTSFPELRDADIQDHQFSFKLDGYHVPDWEDVDIIRNDECLVLVPRPVKHETERLEHLQVDVSTSIDSQSSTTLSSQTVATTPLSQNRPERNSEDCTSRARYNQVKRIRDLDRLNALCEHSTETKIKTYTSQSGEAVSYIDFDEDTWRALRILVLADCPKKLIIRQEYEEAVRYLESELSKLPLGVCITGQPGIGKSHFLIHALYTRLRKRLPTAFQTLDGGSYVIIEGRTYNLDDMEGFEPEYYPSLVWALSDSTGQNQLPSRWFRRDEFRIIHAASPQPHCREWTRGPNARIWVMDLWPKAELEALGYLSEGVTSESLLSLAAKYGSVPKSLLQLARFPKTQTELTAKLNIGVKNFVEDPGPFLYNVLTHNTTDEVFPIAFHIRPAIFDSRLLRSQAVVTIPSRLVFDMTVDTLAEKGGTTQADFFSAIVESAYFPSGNGDWVYEAFIHTTFMSQYVLPCTWTRSPSSAAPPKAIHGAGPQSQSADRLPFYWRPKGRDHQGIDAVLCDDRCVVMIHTCATLDPDARRIDPSPSPLPAISQFRKIASESNLPIQALPEHLLFFGQSEEECKSMCAAAAEALIGEEWENVSIGYCVVSMTSEYR